MSEILPGVALLCIMVAGGIWGYKSERREWNSGICAKSGLPWQMFDMDSQGGRGYTDGQGNYTWISWPVDRERRPAHVE